jgi:hypothetical protein
MQSNKLWSTQAIFQLQLYMNQYSSPLEQATCTVQVGRMMIAQALRYLSGEMIMHISSHSKIHPFSDRKRSAFNNIKPHVLCCGWPKGVIGNLKTD